MIFQVVWLQTALNELATIWVEADSVIRQAITEATHAIDGALQANPANQGDSREEGERVFFVYPLGIQFQIDAQHSLVRVLHVWDIRRRR